MKSTFASMAQTGQNHWWRYVLTILATVAAVIIANVIIQQAFPAYKALFPENQFGKDLGTFILIGVVFGLALIAFSVAAKKLHGRPVFSYISVRPRFSWGQYMLGFLIWGGLLFVGGLLLDYDLFEAFLNGFNAVHFLTLFLVGFVTIGIQSFFEELIIRGYFLQGLHVKLKRTLVLVLVNALIFALLHFGYGIGSFIHSFTFGIAFALIVLLQNRIEFASGAHNANNLILSLIFLDLADATNSTFSWAINWPDMFVHLAAIAILVGVVYKFFRK